MEDMASDSDYEGPATPVTMLRLMDKKQSHISDRKGVSNRAMSLVLKNNAAKVNSATEDIKVSGGSHMLVYHDRVRYREELIKRLEIVILALEGPLQLQFDGKKINGRERLVVCVEWADKNGCR